MIDISKDIDSLSNFKRNTTAFMDRLKSSGRPIALTVNGKAEMVLQDAKSYQELLDALEFAQAITSLRSSLKDIPEGRTKPAEQVFDELVKQL